MTGMLLLAETVDGLIHQLGGTRLRANCMLETPHHGIAPPPSSVDGDVCPRMGTG
jgi:hypothetical protein